MNSGSASDTGHPQRRCTESSVTLLVSSWHCSCNTKAPGIKCEKPNGDSVWSKQTGVPEDVAERGDDRGDGVYQGAIQVEEVAVILVHLSVERRVESCFVSLLQIRQRDVETSF